MKPSRCRNFTHFSAPSASLKQPRATFISRDSTSALIGLCKNQNILNAKQFSWVLYTIEKGSEILNKSHISQLHVLWQRSLPALNSRWQRITCMRLITMSYHYSPDHLCTIMQTYCYISNAGKRLRFPQIRRILHFLALRSKVGHSEISKVNALLRAQEWTIDWALEQNSSFISKEEWQGVKRASATVDPYSKLILRNLALIGNQYAGGNMGGMNRHWRLASNLLTIQEGPSDQIWRSYYKQLLTLNSKPVGDRLDIYTAQVYLAESSREALAAFDDMREANVSPNQRIWIYLLEKLMDERLMDLGNLFSGFRHMLFHDKLRIPKRLVVKALQTTVRNKADAFKLLKVAKFTLAVQITRSVWRTFLQTLLSFGHLEEATSLHIHGTRSWLAEARSGRSDAEAWNIILQSNADYGKRHSIPQKLNIVWISWKAALQSGICLQPRTLQILTRTALTALDLVSVTWNNQPPWKAVLCIFLSADHRLANKLSPMLWELGITPDKAIAFPISLTDPCWRCLLTLVAETHLYHLLAPIVEVMVLESGKNTTITLCAALHYLAEAGDIDKFQKLSQDLWNIYGSEFYPTNDQIAEYASLARIYRYPVYT